jgi:hypothetical protein
VTLKAFAVAALLLFPLLPLAADAVEPAPEVKEIEYRKFIDAFHLKDFIDNKADITSVVRFQFGVQPENKDMTWHDVTFSIDGVDYRPDRYWSLDLPISGDLYDRNVMVTRTSRLPGKFGLGIALVVVGQFDRTVDRANLVRAKAHYDDLISHASFAVRNFAPDMSQVAVRGDDASGRCFIDGVESEAKAKPFCEKGEIVFDLKTATKPPAKGIACSSAISALLLSDD